MTIAERIAAIVFYQLTSASIALLEPGEGIDANEVADELTRLIDEECDDEQDALRTLVITLRASQRSVN